MSESKIRRKYKALTVTLGTSEANSTAIRWDDVAGGTLVLGTVNTAATSVQIWAASAVGGTYGRLYDASGSAADVTLAGAEVSANSTAYALPDAAYGAGAIKLVAGQAAGTAASATVLLKT